MPSAPYQPWLHRFAVFTAVATLGLIGLGGLVTSHGVGLAVPDWPTTYGYNMFLFPISGWTGGIFYEHTHRLYASCIGLLTTVLAAWIWLRDSRVWIKWFVLIAFFTVVLQGVLGGLRVTMFKTELGIFHATVAQLFLAMLSAIAVFTSKPWLAGDRNQKAPFPRFFPWLTLAASLLILGQLILGATMRHQHAGLAVPDFPLAYGKLWPSIDEASLAAINQKRIDARDFGAVTAFHIHLHMAHRIGAVVVLAAVAACWFAARQALWQGAPGALFRYRLVCAWAGLIVLQALLGAATVWSNKAADIATLHVVLGAASLSFAAILTILAFWRTVDREAFSTQEAREGYLAGAARLSLE